MALSHRNGIALTTLSAIDGISAISAIDGISAALGGGGGLSPVSGMTFWHKADAQSFANDDPVGTYVDSSGNGHDLTQATGGKKPLFKTGIVNSQPALLFDGVNDILKSSTFTFARPFSLFLVVKAVAAPTGNGIIADGFGADTMEPYMAAGGTTLHIYAGADIDTSVSLGTSSFHVIAITCSSSGDMEVWIDGVSSGTGGGLGASAPAGLTLGANAGDNSYSNIYLPEDIGYTSELNTSDRQTNEDYLGDKYGISITH